MCKGVSYTGIIHMNIHKVIRDFFEYMIVVSLILDCNSAYLYLQGMQNIMRWVVLIMLSIGVLGVVCTSSFLRKNIIYLFFEAILLILYFSIFLFFRYYNVKSAIQFIIVVFLFLIYYKTNDQKDNIELINKFINIVTIVAIISMFFWIFGTLLNVINPNSIVYSSWSGKKNYFKPIKNYHYMYFETQNLDFFSLKLIRNSAIFCEAPMASLCFSCAIFSMLFIVSNISKFKIIILELALLSTFSTTGTILTILAFILYYFIKKPTNSLTQIIKVIIVPLFCIIAIFVIQVLLEKKLEQFSGSLRLDDYLVGLKVWKDYPMFGTGFANTDYFTRYMLTWRESNIGFSNTIMAIPVYGGIYWMLPFIIIIISGFYKSLKNKKLKSASFILLFVLTVCVTYFPYQYIFVYFMFYICSIKCADYF